MEELLTKVNEDSKNALQIHLNLARVISAFSLQKDKPEAWTLFSAAFLSLTPENYKINWLGMVRWDKNWKFFFSTLKQHGIKIKVFVHEKQVTQVRLMWQPLTP